MQSDLETIFTHGDITFAVGRDRRLYINGDPIVTDSKLVLDRWVKAAVVIAGLSTLALAVVEIGRALSYWT